MKKITLLVCSLITSFSFAQNNFYWSGSGASDNIDQADNWFTSGNPSSGDNLYFNNTEGGRNWPYSNYGLGSFFGDIITYSGAGGIKWRGDDTKAYKFENNNDSNLFEIEANIGNRDTSDMFLISNEGGITVLNGISINEGKIIVAGETILTVHGVISGTGSLIKEGTNSIVLNGVNTYSGNTEIDNGEVWIGENGSATSSLFYVGNGTQQSNTTKLWISDLDGGTTFASNIVNNPGNIGTRIIGSFNTSGSNEFSGDITNNSSNGLRLSALDTNSVVIFSGDISGSNYIDINDGSGTVIFSGNKSYSGATIVQSGILKLQGNLEFSDIDVESGATLEIDGDVTVKSLQVNNGGTVIVNTGKSLTVLNDLSTITGANLTLNSSSSSYSSLIVNGDAFTQSVTYNRYVNEIAGTGTTTGGNDIISAPLVGQEFGAFATANPSLAQHPTTTTLKAFAPFNNTNGEYENYNTVDNENTELVSGMGYRAASSTTGGSTLKFSGGINTSSVPVNISVGTHPTYGGWNLIGNPYPSYVSFKAFYDAVADVVYTGDPLVGAVGSNSQFDAGNDAVYGYNASTSIWTIWDLNNIEYDTDKIAPGQGFFVKSKVGGGTVTFTNAMRSIGSSDDFITTNKTTTTNVIKSTIKLSTSTKEFNTNLYFREGNTRGLDRGYDTATFAGNANGIFTHLVEENIGLELYNQSLPYTDINDVIVPLGIKANAGEQISISLDNTGTPMPSNINVYLEDTVTNTFTLLNDGDYTITLPTTLDGTGRYFVRFQSEALSINDETLSALQIYTPKNSKTLVVKGNLQSDTQLSIYDIQGRVILHSGLDTSTLTNTISTEQLNTGIFIVQLTNATQIKTQKVIIR